MMPIAEFLSRHDVASIDEFVSTGLAEALYRLDWMTAERVERIATRWLAEGRESEAIVKLASGLADSRNRKELFAKALHDLGYVLIPEDDDRLSEAGLRVARLVAREIVAGTIDPDEGVAILADLCWRVGYPEWAIPFDYLADGVDLSDAMTEARKLLESD